MYKKRLQSLLDCSLRVRMIASAPIGAHYDRLDLVPNFAWVGGRFLHLLKSLRKFCSSRAMLAFLKDESALAIRQDADYAVLSVLTVLRGHKLNA